MDLSLSTFFFPLVMVRPNRSAAGNKLNLFLCFASSFLPFLLQIAKKTFLRRRWGWEVGKK